MLVSGLRASEHDSFSGACYAKITTPPQAAGGGGARVDAGMTRETYPTDEFTFDVGASGHAGRDTLGYLDPAELHRQ